MDRKKAIDDIFFYSDIDERDIVVTSPGMISREVFHMKDRPRNFYVMGSMGATISIGIGIALNTKYNVFVIVGEGDVLMDLGSLSLAKSLCLDNLFIHIIDNNCYSSTGSQPTVSNCVNFKELGGWCTTVFHITPEKGDAPRIPLTPMEIKKRFTNALKN